MCFCYIQLKNNNTSILQETIKPRTDIERDYLSSLLSELNENLARKVVKEVYRVYIFVVYFFQVNFPNCFARDESNVSKVNRNSLYVKVCEVSFLCRNSITTSCQHLYTLSGLFFKLDGTKYLLALIRRKSNEICTLSTNQPSITKVIYLIIFLIK